MSEHINNGGQGQQAARVDEEYQSILDALEFDPDESHTVSDMANVGYSLMKAIARNMPDYTYSCSPAEIVVDLINARDEAALSAQPAERQGECEPVAYMTRRGAVYQGKHYNASKGQVPLCPCRCQTHPAAPVGVPDRWLETVADAAGSLDKRGDRQMALRLMWLHGQMLAAAPSAREVQA